MARQTRSAGATRNAIRQSVTIPVPLANEVRRIAKERHLTISRALVILAERGLEAGLNPEDSIDAAHHRFMHEKDPTERDEAGKDLIRTIFGKDAIAHATNY